MAYNIGIRLDLSLRQFLDQQMTVNAKCCLIKQKKTLKITFRTFKCDKKGRK